MPPLRRRITHLQLMPPGRPAALGEPVIYDGGDNSHGHYDQLTHFVIPAKAGIHHLIY
jgi:hypothetical protein